MAMVVLVNKTNPVEWFMTDDGLKPFVKHEGKWIRLSDTQMKIDRIRAEEIVSRPHSFSQNLSQ